MDSEWKECMKGWKDRTGCGCCCGGCGGPNLLWCGCISRFGGAPGGGPGGILKRGIIGPPTIANRMQVIDEITVTKMYEK